MKSKKVLIIVITIILSILCIGFVTYFVLTSSKNAEDKVQNANIEVQNGTKVSPKFLKVDCKDLCLFEGEEYDITNFVSTINDKDWIVEYTYDDELIEIQDNYLLKIKPYKIASTIVYLKVTPNFDYSLYEEFNYRTFPLNKSFTINIMPLNFNINYNITKNDINDFTITLFEQNLDLQKNNLHINSNDITYSQITQSNGNIIIDNVSIKNKLATNFLATYCIIDDNNKEKQINISIPLKQEKEFIEYTWVKDLGNQKYLYLTKNNEYNVNFPNCSELYVVKNFEITKATTCLEIVNGQTSGLEINGLEIIAKQVGEYSLQLVCCDEIVYCFNIEVKDIEIYSVNFGATNRSVQLGEEIDLTIKNEDIIAQSDLAKYNIVYTIVSEKQTATINENNIFTCFELGECVVRITVRDIIQDITITITSREDVYFIDSQDNLTNNIEVAISDLNNGELVLYGNPDFPYENFSDVRVSTDKAEILVYDPLFILNTIMLKFKTEMISINDSITISIAFLNDNNQVEITSFVVIKFI